MNPTSIDVLSWLAVILVGMIALLMSVVLVGFIAVIISTIISSIVKDWKKSKEQSQ